MKTQTVAALERDFENSPSRSKRLKAALALFEHYYYTDTIIARGYADTSLRLARSINKPADLAKAYIAKGRAHWRLAEYDEGFACFTEAKMYVHKVNDDALLRQVLYLIGNSHLVKGDYPNAVEAYMQSLDLAKKADDKLSIQIILNNLGILYTRIGDYERAFLYHSESLRLGIEHHDPEIGSGYLNLGIIRYHEKQPDEAMKYFLKAKDEFIKHDNWFGLVKANLDIGNILLEQNKLSDAEAVYTPALELSTQQGFHAETVRLLHRLGDLANEKKDYRSAMKFIQRSIELSRRIKSPSDEAYALYRKAAVEIKQRKYAAAKESMNSAIDICTKIGEFRTAYEVHRLAADLAKREKRNTDAIEHLEEYIRLKDECYKRDREQEVRDEELRLRVTEAAQDRERTARENDHLRKQIENATIELKELSLQLVGKNELIDKITKEIRTRQPNSDLVSKVDTLLSSPHPVPEQVVIDDVRLRERLFEIAPNLTPKELKVCQLIYKDLSTKDIASLMYASHRTIEVHRLNIRRKLGIGKNVDLKLALMKL